MEQPFKPQAWHVEVQHADCDPNCKHNGAIAAFVTRKVAEEARDEWNADTNKLGFPGDAFICLCDCPDRECKYL